MNKGITILILAVLLAAMGLVFYSQTLTPENPRAAAPAVSPGPISGSSGGERPSSSGAFPAGGVQAPSPLPQYAGTSPERPQNGGLASIEPPLSSGAPQAPVLVAGGGQIAPAPAAPEHPSASARTEPAAPQKAPSAQPAAAPATGKTPEQTKAPEPAKTPEPAKNHTAGSSDNGKNLSEKGRHVLKKISLHFAGQRMQLRIEADGAFPCKAFALADPHRLVIDLPGVWTDISAPTVPQNRIIKGVRVGKQATGPRIVLDLEQAPQKHEIVRQGGTVDIFVQ